MAKQSKPKPIHLIQQFGSRCRAICDTGCQVQPVEALIVVGNSYCKAKGTFNPKKVTCKRCLRHPDYKTAMDKIKYPLLFWRENAI